jgi:hypothetical protein
MRKNTGRSFAYLRRELETFRFGRIVSVLIKKRAVLEEYEFCHLKIVFALSGQNAERTETTLAKRLAKTVAKRSKVKNQKTPSATLF